MLETAAQTYPQDAIYICGHSGAKFDVLVEHGDLLFFRDYLSGLLEHVSQRIAAGDSRETIVALDNLLSRASPTFTNRRPTGWR